MAKSKRKNKKNTRQITQRVNNLNTRRGLLREKRKRYKHSFWRESAIIQDDNKKWHPDRKHRTPLYSDGRGVQYTLSKTPIRDATKARIAFANPKRVMVCIRRKIRREVLFAFKGVGSGKKVNKRRRYTENSKIKC